MAAVSGSDFPYDSAAFKVLYTCYALLAVKMLIMSLLTARSRWLKKVVMNPEDTKLGKKLSVRFNDPDVERIRRAHLNDLENIPLFTVTAFWYAALNPNSLLTSILIITFTLARYAHTYVYAIKVTKQPARFICYVVGYAVTAFMALFIILTFKD